MSKLPKISRRQVFNHFMVTSLAEGGRKNLDEDEPKGYFRKRLFNFFQRRQWNEAKRLRKIHGNTTYRGRK